MNVETRVWTRRSFMSGLLIGGLWGCQHRRHMGLAPGERFVCPPCGCSMQGVTFDEPGICPACGMLLTPDKETTLGRSPRSLPTGGGVFRLPGRRADIEVHFYRPPSFTADSPILIVIPGTGRNAMPYRNAWLSVARAKGVLVAALHYPPAAYDFAAYHMGGVIRDLEFPAIEGESVLHLRDEDIRFALNPARETWLFSDFDRAFDHLKRATGSRRPSYDLFGHSAGAQILHRLALFHPSSRANRVVAANAGFYTMPDLDRAPLTGMAGTGIDEDGLRQALAVRLTVLVGGEDDGDGAGGVLLHTPTVDQQGLGRRSRGVAFFRAGQAAAKRLGVEFRWQLHTVTNVGHDFRRMSEAAAARLY